MDTLQAPYDSRDNRSGISITASRSGPSGTGRSGAYSGSYYDGTESLQNVFIQGVSGSIYSQNPKTTQSIIRAIAAQGNQYELERENQRLRAKVSELETWIEEIGKPSEILAAKLEDRYRV